MNRVVLLVVFFSCLSTFLVDAHRGPRRQTAARPVQCKDISNWAAACPILAKSGICYGAYSKLMARYCAKSCPRHCKTVPKPAQPLFKIYSTGYNKCVTVRWMSRRSYRNMKFVTVFYPVLYIAQCRTWYNNQQWRWTSNGQLQISSTLHCLTLRGNSVTLTKCDSYNQYQKWTCQGNWIKLRFYRKYLVPFIFAKHNKIIIRSYATNSCKWVKYGSRGSLCEKGVVTPKPKSTPPPTRVKTPPRTTTPPAPPTTPAPPPTPPPIPPTVGVIRPPLPASTLPPPPPVPGNTPPAPPLPTDPKPPPPPSNQNVKCGTKSVAPGQVINGTTARVGSSPWQIGIRTCANCQISCGGTLIDDEWVVTAAHCVTNWVREDLFLVAGEIDQATVSGNEQHFKCKQIITHEQYKVDAPFDKDVALLQLDKYAVYNDHVRPLCLPDSGTVLSDQHLCTVTGFGTTEQGGLKSLKLLQANVKIISRPTCKAAYLKLKPDPKAVTDNMVCAGFDRGGTDACQGDSGGPLTCFQRGSAKFILGGIVSWGVGCAQANQYGVYTNVAAMKSWIKQKLPSM